MDTNISIKETLNLEGLLCPIPVVKLSNAVKNIDVGDIIAATATDAGVMMDIPAWCKSTGNDLISLDKEDRIFRFVVRRVK